MTPFFKLFLLFIAAVLAGALLGAVFPAQALEQKGRVITLTAEEHSQCQEEGGCYVMSKKQLFKALQQAIEKTVQQRVDDGLAECRSKT